MCNISVPCSLNRVRPSNRSECGDDVCTNFDGGDRGFKIYCCIHDVFFIGFIPLAMSVTTRVGRTGMLSFKTAMDLWSDAGNAPVQQSAEGEHYKMGVIACVIDDKTMPWPGDRDRKGE